MYKNAKRKRTITIHKTVVEDKILLPKAVKHKETGAPEHYGSLL